MTKTTWRLAKNNDRRFNLGHPWVFSNELQSSPKGVEPGAIVHLSGPGGEPLAVGFGNPHSLIAFRELERSHTEIEWTPGKVLEKIEKAKSFRQSVGVAETSHRLTFGEADGIPGLMIDAYRLDSKETPWVHVVQAQTAGADRFLPAITEFLANMGPVVVKNTSEIRKLEGLTVDPVRVVGEVKDVDLSKAKILIAVGSHTLTLQADLLEGQKTGLFLDQRSNIEFLLNSIQKGTFQKKGVRILDLCSYVGQWGSAIAQHLKSIGHDAHVTFVDVSDRALQFAQINGQASGAASTECVQMDVLGTEDTLPAAAFDIVVCDPPAFIGSRKNIPTGRAAYLKLNQRAIAKVRAGGWLVSCSCSGLLTEEDFNETLAKASHRSKREIVGFGRGAQAKDHPVLPRFPEGRYLKAFFGRCE